MQAGRLGSVSPNLVPSCIESYLKGLLIDAKAATYESLESEHNREKSYCVQYTIFCDIVPLSV